MNQRAIGALGAVALAAAAAVVGGAAWSGRVTQQRLEGDVARLQATLPIKVTSAVYERGLFSATYTVTLASGCEGGADAATKAGWTLRHRIQHGPLPGFTRIGKAVLYSTLDMPDDLRRKLVNSTPEQALLTAHTELGLTGGFHSLITTPALEFKATPDNASQASVQGMRLTLRGPSLRSGTMTYDLMWPGLTARFVSDASDSQLTVGAFTAHGESNRDSDASLLAFMTGTGQFEWDRFEMTSTPKGDGAKPMKWVFTGLKGTTESKQDNDLLNQLGSLRAEGQVNDVKVSKIEFNTSLKRLHLPTYLNFLQQTWSPAALCTDHADQATSMAQAQASMASLAAMLPSNPEVAVDKFSMEIDGQPGELSYAAGTQGVTAEEATGPGLQGALMTKAYAHGQAKLPVAWFEKLMIDSSNSASQAQVKAMFEAMLGQAVDAGYVVRDGRMLTSQFKLEKGQLLVNNKPLGGLAAQR